MINLFNKITSLLFFVFIILSFKIINSNYYIDISNKEYFKPFLLYFYKDDKLYSYEEYIRNSF